jgi:hypothetical protein
MGYGANVRRSGRVYGVIKGGDNILMSQKQIGVSLAIKATAKKFSGFLDFYKYPLYHCDIILISHHEN